MNRIKFLDGFRGIAILLVVMFHAYSRWASIVPLGKDLSNFVIFKQGFLGVQLFFLISGFVILMTLEKSDNFFIFIKKRWLRLFPVMLIATLFVFLSAQLLPERPAGIPKITSIFPGLLFVSPALINKLTGLDVGILEGSFWSLYVEVKFYILFGVLYFYFGKIKAILGILFFYLFWLGLKTMIFLKINSAQYFFEVCTIFFSFHYFGWFATGAIAYLYYSTKKYIFIGLAILVGLFSVLSLNIHSTAIITMMLLLGLMFLATIYFDWLKNIFGNKIFVFFGFVSYPLYLIHENTMIAIIIYLRKTTIIPNILLPIIPIICLVIIAFFIAKIVEPKIQKVIKKILF